jgi:YfiH family protein
VHGRQVLDLDGLQVAAAGTAAANSAATPADAAVSGRPGTVCAILTADCLPVLLAAQSGERVGAVHAGWRGLAGGVIEAAVRAMGTPVREMLAWLGPAIGPQHFEIGPEVRDELLRADPGAQSAFTRNARGRFMADLFALARRRLASVGVDQVYGGGECTYSQAEIYFSHRRDGLTGRQATLIWMR